MKRILLLTGYDAAMKPIGDLTSRIHEAYAERHHYDFRCVRDFADGSHPSWQKVGFVLEAFADGYDAALWLDADAFVTNPELRWCGPESGLHVSRDWGPDVRGNGDFSAGNFVAWADTLPLWQEAQRMAYRWQNVPLWDQGCLREMYRELEWVRQMVHVYERRFLNAVPAEVGAVEPWQSGDFLCHLTMLTMQRRVELFYEIRSEIGT